jgi:Flp pilus assembly protein TadG
MQRGIRLPKRRHRGVGTLELILTLPVVVVLLVATVEYTTVAVLQSVVTHAATVAARESGKCADINVAVHAAQTIVAKNYITISDTSGSGTMVTLEDGLLPAATYGDSALAGVDVPTSGIAADEVRVTLCVNLAATPLCDPLQAFGFSLAKCRLHASAVVKKN